MKAYMHNHPKIRNWPPVPSGSYGAGDIFAMPGDGKLCDVKFVDASPQHAEYLLVSLEFRGAVGTDMVFATDPQDHRALPALLNELKKLIGAQIRDISNMEFDL